MKKHGHGQVLTEIYGKYPKDKKDRNTLKKRLER